MGFLPVFFDVSARPVLLVGAGPAEGAGQLHLLRCRGRTGALVLGRRRSGQ